MRRYREPIAILLLLAVPLVFYLSNNKAPRDHNLFDRAVVWVSAPVQWLVTSTLGGGSRAWRRYVALMDVEQEVEALREENAELRAELAAGEEQRRENERLRRLLSVFDSQAEMRQIYARIIAISPSPLFRSVRIDRGKRHGVRLGAPVTNHDGVVGRVAALGGSFADVMLLVDANSSLDALVGRTRARARVRGTGGDTEMELEVNYLPRTAAVEPGDVLVSSGAGAIFPKGLLVGHVTEVERPAFGLYQRAIGTASVDFGRLEEVLVLAPAETTPETEP